MSKNKCPVAKQCSVHKSGNTSYSDATSSSVPTPESGLFENNFMESLVSFMKQCHQVIENWKKQQGQKDFAMTEEERQAKMREIIALIAQKEQEISQLEAQRSALDTRVDASGADASRSGLNSSGGGFSSPQQRGPGYFPSTTPPAMQVQQPNYYDTLSSACLESCVADCNEADASGYGQQTQLYPQIRTTSTPAKRSTRPPAFTTSQYDSTGCDSDCPNLQDNTMNKYYRKQRMNPS